MYRNHSSYGETHKSVPNTTITQEYAQHFPVKESSTKPYTRIHRVILRSKDLTTGSKSDAIFRVDVPEIKSQKCKLVVESFYMTNGTSYNDLVAGVYHVHWRYFSDPLSYSSINKSTTDILMTLKGTSFINSSDVGISVADKSIFQGNINISLSSADITDFATKVEDWVLTLNVIEE